MPSASASPGSQGSRRSLGNGPAALRQASAADNGTTSAIGPFVINPNPIAAKNSQPQNRPPSSRCFTRQKIADVIQKLITMSGVSIRASAKNSTSAASTNTPPAPVAKPNNFRPIRKVSARIPSAASVEGRRAAVSLKPKQRNETAVAQ